MNREPLLAGFYTIRQFEYLESSCQAEIELNPEHPVYEGHFPGTPVMPGVTMLSIIKECVAKVCGKEVHYDSIRSCKYISVVNPFVDPVLKLLFSIGEDGALQATLSKGTGVVLKLKASVKFQ